MIKRLLKKLNPSTPQKANWDDPAVPPSFEVQNFIRDAKRVQHRLEGFAGEKAGCTYISLGQNCSSAWYLKQIGLKTESYPFDWIFSSPKIIQDCIEDNFSKFLDKSLIYPNDNSSGAGHSYYHSNLFNHRNPLNSDQDYNYYKRCCERFLHKLNSKSNIVFLMTMINEHDKRKEWSSGFIHDFKIPENQSTSSIESLLNTLVSKNNTSKLIVVDHYTNQCREVISDTVDKNLFYIRFTAAGSSTGVLYTDALDDFCYKLALSGLL